MVDSKCIKAALSCYFRFRYGCNCIATEVGRYNSDFLAHRKGDLIEIEIKTSKSDLSNDFKKDKHIIYETEKADWVPHFFYFAVPKELVEYAVLKSIDRGYGVMVISDHGRYVDRTSIVKRAKRIHARPIKDKVIAKIWARLASEMSNLRIDQQRWDRRVKLRS